MAGDLLYLTIVLQKAARYVQRDVRAIDHAVQQEQVFGDDFLDVIRNEHLVAIQLDFAALQLHLALDLGEIQNALQAERIIHIQVDPEKRIVIIVECLAVKFLYSSSVQSFGFFRYSGCVSLSGLSSLPVKFR